MAKSMRSKSKRAFRSKKREAGVYAATEAARLQRLNAKLSSLAEREGDGDIRIEAEGDGESSPDINNTVLTPGPADGMDLDLNASEPKRVSTHGPRGSRREEWRTSKGWDARPKVKGMNRQGGVAARRKAGRAKRRR